MEIYWKYINIVLLVICFTKDSNAETVLVNDIEVIGDNLEESRAGVDAVNSTLILIDEVSSPGVLFAYAAWFRYPTPVTLQIWRLVNTTSIDDIPLKKGQFRFILVQELQITPSVTGEEVIYFTSKLAPCFLVEPGDRIGIYQERPPGAIAYVFDPRTPRAQVYQDPPGESLRIGDAIIFDTLVFPYDLSLKAYVDKDLSYYEEDQDFVTCRPDLLIPEHHEIERVTTTPAPPITGAPGDTGPTGPKGPQGLPGPRGPTGIRGEKGDKGDIGASGPTGRSGSKGDLGPAGLKGENGETGLRGPQGIQGLQGERGLKGEPGASGKIVYVDKGSNGKPLAVKDEELSTLTITLIIWLIILTLLILILILIICAVSRRRHRDHKGNNHSKLVEEPASSTNSNTSIQRLPSNAADYPHSWLNSLKEGSEMGVGLDTISTPTSSLTPPISSSTPHSTAGYASGSTGTLVVGHKPVYIDEHGKQQTDSWTNSEVTNY